MTAQKTAEATSPATASGSRLSGAKEIATGFSAALTAGSRAYVNGILELGRTLGGFGREVAMETGRHVRATVEARSLREVAELQAAWAQHRVETSTAQAKEFADVAHARAIGVIAPFVAMMAQNKTV
jgi:hypothetical protein